MSRPRKPIFTRRRFLRAAVGGLAAGTATYAYATTIAPHRLTVEHVTIPVRGLPPHLHSTRIVQLSDFHAGPTVSMAHLKNALDMAADLQPHYILFTGDFVDSTLSHLQPLCELLRPIAQRFPCYGSTGNHDFGPDFHTHSFADTVAAAVAAAGVRMLRNAFHQPAAQPAPGDLCFVGIDDFWSGRFDPAALENAPQDATTIVLSHNPDSYESLAPYRFHLMLSGHTHGGQVRIPFYGALIVPVQHRERSAGLFHLDPPSPTQPHRALYVTRGIGHLRKIRLFCPPEITCITLTSSS